MNPKLATFYSLSFMFAKKKLKKEYRKKNLPIFLNEKNDFLV